MGCSLRGLPDLGQPISLFVTVLRFQFLILHAFTGICSGLVFSLLTNAARVLEPPQSDGLLI